ncbi:MAG: Na+/H+ antiporter NhaC family protein [Gammaproteobacteria bacterium]|nr:Na+/H+ antiporter NhaC family protein [Gammaproteobacteria bacterium]
MNTLIQYADSPISLVPAVVALGMAIISRRVLLSLGVGIILGSLLLNDFGIYSSCYYLFNAIKGLFIEDSGINAWNTSIIMFLLLLGMITAVLTLSGGTKAFASWAQKKVRSKRGAKMLAATLGVFIFVDDYFNSLAVGTVSRPVTDKFNVSRAKLAYILDSTSAPMCVLMPVSSWGAYIITVIGGILVGHQIVEISPLHAFVQLAPMNFYAIFALAMVFAVIWFELDIGAMKKQEYIANLETQNTSDSNTVDANVTDLDEELNIVQSDKGRVSDLIVPILVLIIATVSAMVFTGSQSLATDNKEFSLLGAFENTDVGLSLCYGGGIGLATALYTVIRQQLPAKQVTTALHSGIKSMLGAILVLCFAWVIAGIIKDMNTGKYLSTLVQGIINPSLLPLVLFALSGFMAFATGTSWGTFGIMLPIAGDLAAATEISLMLPVLAAVLAGSVFGDHCSPISDTTILSSTGARCNHIMHVTTQLPYALITAIIAGIGYLALGLTNSVLMGFGAATLSFTVLLVLLKVIARNK